MVTGLRIAEQLLLTGSIALPALVLLYKARLFPGLRMRWTVLACCVLVYAMILAQAFLVDVRLELELRAFDLDGDGGFSPHEQTPAQQEAMERFSNDAARGVAPLTALIVSPLSVALAFGIVALVTRTRRALMRLFTRTA